VDLREIREICGWSQEEAGYVLGMTQRSVSRLENGTGPRLTDDQKIKLRRMRAMAESRRKVDA
jgi:DNA-binding XRE family transcriptional regulator